MADRLALATDLPLREIPSPQNPQEALLHLAKDSTGWLAAVPIDAGLPLLAGGSWAEALGAWRQPTLLVLSGAQLETGLPAAATALLRQWGVPLLGLIQAEGPWQAEARRRDGLPWLGILSAAPEGGEPPVGAGTHEGDGVAEGDGLEAVLAAMLLRWRQLRELPAAD